MNTKETEKIKLALSVLSKHQGTVIYLGKGRYKYPAYLLKGSTNKCKYCHATIMWAITPNAKYMTINPKDQKQHHCKTHKLRKPKQSITQQLFGHSRPGTTNIHGQK